MKIRKLQLKNIGVFDDETIEFKPCPAKDKAEIHILTGQNGTGKTTILQGLASVFQEQRMDTNSFTSKFRHSISERKNNKIEANNLVSVSFEDENHALIIVEITNNKITAIVQGDFTHKDKNITDKGNAITAEYRKLFYLRYKVLSYAVFAFSGYRQLNSEKIEALREPKDFHPLSKSLDFVKDYSHKNQLTVNQLIANNISKSAIEKGRNNEKSERFAKVISSIEEIIAEITGWKIEFDMQTEPINLVTKVNGEELEFDVLPDGLRSLISWIADLLGRVDLLKWNDDLPIFEKNLILFLDEIEVHLHPAWQRKVLPVVQKLFKNSQIFVSTHSPFVVNSVDDAWVYELDLNDGKAKVREKSLTKTTESIQTTLEEIFEIPQIFGYEVQKDLDRFYELRNKIKNNGGDADKEFREIAKRLLKKSEEQNSVELQTIISFELKQLKYEL